VTRRRSRLVLVFAAALLGACVVPSLEDLEAERERTCDNEHPCTSGYDCVGGVCKKSGTTDCTPTQTRPCGETRGECEAGTETCSEAGAWGACMGGVGPVTEVCDGKDNDCDGATDEDVPAVSCGVDAGVCAGKAKACVGGVLETTCSAASFGADYEATETRCDGLDNDCDTQVDEGIPPQPCPKDAGVCAGALRTCTGGSLTACTDATYLANDPAYEPLEASCDGKDNDCDGLTDTWAPRAISEGSQVHRRAAAVVFPGTGTAARRNALVLYEEGNRVVARVLNTDGTLSTARYPSVTVTSVSKASAPALGTNGTDVAEAWFEELSGPVYRLPVALAGPTGEAIANGSPGVLPVGSMPGPGQKVAVAMTATRIILAYAHLDSPGASTSTVVAASCPRNLDAGCTTRTLGAGRNPAVLATGDVALVAYEAGNRLSLAKLSVPAAGTVMTVSNIAFGGSSEHDPALLGTVSAVELYSVVPGAPDTLWHRAGDCSGTCDPTMTSSFPTSAAINGAFTGSALALSGTKASGATVLAWEDGHGGRRVARMMVDTGTRTFRDVSPTNETGRRPTPLLTGTAGFEVVYDVEGGSGALADQAVSRRFCGP